VLHAKMPDQALAAVASVIGAPAHRVTPTKKDWVQLLRNTLFSRSRILSASRGW
jgi:hypothetical protein